jgi:hypothetical protein
MENELIRGQRYTFYQKIGKNSIQKTFRANVKDIIFHNMILNNRGIISIVECKTLRLNFHSDCKQATTVYCMPLHCILQIDNMETILQKKSKLPVDVLRIIDNYL